MSLKQELPGAWSLWGDRLVAGLAIVTCCGLAWAWVGTYYLGQPVNEILAFDAADTDLLGTEASSRIIFGEHAFGDFQAWIVWASQVLAGGYPDPPPPYLPASFLYGSLYVSAHPLVAVVIHQVVMLGATVVAGGLLLRGVKASRRIVILFFTVVVTVPMVAALDTGNKQGLTVALFMFALVFLQRGRPTPAWLLVGVAIAFKGYPALALAWPIAAGWWRFALRALLVTAGISAALFALMPGGILVNIGRYVEGLTERSGQGMLDAESSLAGLTAKVAGLVAGPDAMSALGGSGLWAVVCSALWVGLVMFLAWTRSLPQWAIALLALSTLQMAVPTSYNYSLGWASIAAIWFGMGTLFGEASTSARRPSDRDPSVLRWAALAAIVATLAPLGFRFALNGVVVNVSTIVSPTLLALFMGVSVVFVLRRRLRGCPDIPSRASEQVR